MATDRPAPDNSGNLDGSGGKHHPLEHFGDINSPRVRERRSRRPSDYLVTLGPDLRDRAAKPQIDRLIEVTDLSEESLDEDTAESDRKLLCVFGEGSVVWVDWLGNGHN